MLAQPKDNDIQTWTLAVMHRIDSTELILAAEMAAGFGMSMTLNMTITTTGTTTMPTRAGTG